jgi:RNA-binding protein 8A
VEGWIVVATNLHEEMSEEDVTDFFSEFGVVQNVHLNLDRRTGFVKGYAFIEYRTRDEADRAVNEATGQTFFERIVQVDYVFVESTKRVTSTRAKTGRSRSRSPGR